jgi:hypothetical protein
MSIRFRRIVLLPAVAGLLGLGPAGPAHGQHLPGQSAAVPQASAEWAMAMRLRAEEGLQAWLNLTDRESWHDLASCFTDRGVLLDGSGAHAVGREAVRALLPTLPYASDARLLGEGYAVVRGAGAIAESWWAGGRPLAVTVEQMRTSGRVAYVELLLARSGDARRVLSVYERGEDGWRIRSQAVWPEGMSTDDLRVGGSPVGGPDSQRYP